MVLAITLKTAPQGLAPGPILSLFEMGMPPGNTLKPIAAKNCTMPASRRKTLDPMRGHNISTDHYNDDQSVIL